MFSCLLKNIGYMREALVILEVAKDLAHDSMNLAQEMVCYERMGKIKQEMGEFEKARIAFKKML